jgi:hypothetical protein
MSIAELLEVIKDAVDSSFDVAHTSTPVIEQPAELFVATVDGRDCVIRILPA